MELLDLFKKFLRLTAVALAELLGDNALLFAEIHFPLRLVNVHLYAGLQLHFDLEHLIFAHKNRIEHRQAQKETALLQQHLTVMVIHLQIRPDRFKKLRCVFLRKHNFCEIPRYTPGKPAMRSIFLFHGIDDCLHLNRIGFISAVGRERLEVRRPVAFFLRCIKLQHFCACNALDQHSGPLAAAHHLPHFTDHTGAEQITQLRLPHGLIPLRQHHDTAVTVHGSIDSLARFLPADLKIYHHMRKGDQTAQRNNRNPALLRLRFCDKLVCAFFLLHFFFHSALRGEKS